LGLLFGAMTRAGLLIASSPDPKATRDAVGVTFRQMMSGFLPTNSSSGTGGDQVARCATTRAYGVRPGGLG
jgi:hypothetical protein